MNKTNIMKRSVRYYLKYVVRISCADQLNLLFEKLDIKVYIQMYLFQNRWITFYTQCIEAVILL